MFQKCEPPVKAFTYDDSNAGEGDPLDKAEPNEPTLRYGTAEHPRSTGNEISKLPHTFKSKEGISIYLVFFEIQAQFWVANLLGLLPLEITNKIVLDPEERANDYEYVQNLLLQRFKLTPEKLDKETKVNTYNKLKDLVIIVQMKKREPIEFKVRFMDEWSNIVSPNELVEKLEVFEDAKKTLKPKFFGNSFKGRD
ncbi:hypothetical protein AVEN_274519-1 [Araneus ventricosus]|uniref:Uncharacterized protein n=1 Tax=Araneus ventricosus TaxID=182803 RepID=A0A4Y2L3F9_ARAVE|nr:hypothetical protein AVEN_274519-1 [Araneus ventricosus]